MEPTAPPPAPLTLPPIRELFQDRPDILGAAAPGQVSELDATAADAAGAEEGRLNYESEPAGPPSPGLTQYFAQLSQGDSRDPSLLGALGQPSGFHCEVRI